MSKSIFFLLTQEIEANGTVSVGRTVTNLRKNRVFMVQTPEQYVCIFKSLLTYYEDKKNNAGQARNPRPVSGDYDYA